MRKILTALVAAAFASSLSLGAFAADDGYKAARKADKAANKAAKSSSGTSAAPATMPPAATTK